MVNTPIHFVIIKNMKASANNTADLTTSPLGSIRNLKNF